MIPHGVGTRPQPDYDKVARAICAETCAHYGEPPCWRIVPDQWPNPNCDEPGCGALAAAAIGAMN